MKQNYISMWILPYNYGGITMRNEESSIIKCVLENKGIEYSISQLAKELKKDYKNVHTIVKRLEKKGIFSIQSFGNASKIILKQQCHPLVYEAEYCRRKEILKNKNIKNIVDLYQRNMKSKLYVLLLFGSYAKKSQGKNSDIDLLFIVADLCEEEAEKNIQSIASLIPLPLHINIFKEKDFIAMKNSKEQTVGSEVIKNNLILYGIETYYELIQ